MPDRYETEEQLIGDALTRAMWRVGNENARPHDVEDRTQREVTGTVIADRPETTAEELGAIITLMETIEEAMTELLCLFAKADQS